MADKVRTDVLLKDFWRVNERFADLFNAVIFQGKEVQNKRFVKGSFCVLIFAEKRRNV